MLTRILQPRPGGRSWTEVARGGTAAILVMDHGVCRTVRAAFGRPGGGAGRSLLVKDASALDDGDAALWETRRCLVPIVGFRVESRCATPGVGTWVAGTRQPLLAAGLYSPGGSGNRVRPCFSLLVAASPTAPRCRPLYVAGEDAPQWLRMPGGEALRALSPMWPAMDARPPLPPAAAAGARLAAWY